VADEKQLRMQLEWPEGLQDRLASSASETRRRAVVSAGMFHPRFTLRLADAEAKAAGGGLMLGDDRITLILPTSAPSGTPQSEQTVDAAQAQAQGR
jgi:hypothetical protein